MAELRWAHGCVCAAGPEMPKEIPSAWARTHRYTSVCLASRWARGGCWVRLVFVSPHPHTQPPCCRPACGLGGVMMSEFSMTPHSRSFDLGCIDPRVLWCPGSDVIVRSQLWGGHPFHLAQPGAIPVLLQTHVLLFHSLSLATRGAGRGRGDGGRQGRDKSNWVGEVEEGGLGHATPHPYTVTCSLGTDAGPGRGSARVELT